MNLINRGKMISIRKIILVLILIFNIFYSIFICILYLSYNFTIFKFLEAMIKDLWISNTHFEIFFLYTVSIEILFLTLVDRNKTINKSLKKLLLYINIYNLIFQCGTIIYFILFRT